MHPYFIFKDLVTIFAFFLVLSVLIFFYPNLLGRYLWPTLLCLIVHIMVTCAICWKDILLLQTFLASFPFSFFQTFWQRPPLNFNFANNLASRSRKMSPEGKGAKKTEAKVKIYTKTISVRGLFIIKIFRKYIITKINPIIVKYYYKIYNQQITKIINKYLINTLVYTFLLLVGISETIRTKKNDIKKLKDIICLFSHILLLQKDTSLPVDTKHSLAKRQKYQGWASSPLYLGALCVTIKLKLRGCVNGLKEGSKKQIHTKSRLQLPKIMDKHNNEISLEFKQWFAGLTDGDGYIYVNTKGYVGFELTLNSLDEKVLRLLQNKFGGRIHARAGLNAVRYRTQQKDTVYKIIQCLNGLVINNIRLAQLHKACLALNIPILDPQLPDINSAYISGLFDSDGYINIYKSFYSDTYRYQLTIAISNKSLCNIEFLTKVIGGKIYFDKRLNGHYKWIANSKLLHLKLYDYFLKFTPKTIKKHRTFLITEFHELNSIKAYLETDKLSVRYKIWKMFNLR